MIRHVATALLLISCYASAQLPQKQDIEMHLDASTPREKGSAPTRWRGSGPRTRILTCPMEEQAPTLADADWSRRPVLNFDGVDDHLACELDKMVNYTIVAVFAHELSPGEKAGALWTANDGAIGQCFIPFTGDEHYSIYKTWRTVSGDSPFRKGIPYICTLEIHAEKSQRVILYCNNVKVRDCWARTMPGGAFRIGSDQKGFFRGQLAEIVVYRRILTDIERARISMHLTDKWLKPSLAAQGPLVVPVPQGTTCLTTATLDAQLGSRSGELLEYTLLTEPQHGKLLLNGKAISVDDTWMQEDIQAVRLSYSHRNAQQTRDSFRFRVTSLATDSSIEAVLPIQIHPVLAAPTRTHTSPVSVEGDCIGLSSIKVGNQSGVIFSKQRFHIDVPLSTSDQKPSLSITRGTFVETVSIASKWEPLDMMKTKEFYARKGDTLLLTADANRIHVDDGRAKTSFEIKTGKPFTVNLSKPGTTTLRAEMGNKEVAKLSIQVVAVDFLGPIPCSPSFARSKRVVVHADRDRRVVFESCDLTRAVVESAERDGNYADLRIRLRTPAPGWILARLGPHGPVIAACRITPFLLETRQKYGIGAADRFPTGEVILKGTLTLHPRLPDIDILFRFDRRSMAAVDGTPYLLVPGYLYRPGVPGTIRFMGGDLGKGGGFPYDAVTYDDGVAISSDE